MKRSSLSVWSMMLCSGLAAALAVAQPASDPKTLPAKPAKPATPAPTPTPIQVKPQQPAKEAAKPEMTPEEKAMEEAAAPDEHHQKFEKYVGRWDGAMKMYMPGSTEPMPISDTLIARWEPGMGNRFMIMDHTSKIFDKPFRGTATWGYNKATKKYEAIWRDNMGTGMMISYGSMAADGTMTFTGDMDDPMTGAKIKTREIYKWQGDDSFTFEMFQTGPDGKENKAIEATYTKKQIQGRPAINVRPVPSPGKPQTEEKK